MPKVINIHQMGPDCKLDGMTFTQLEAPEGEYRYLSPELTEEQVARYLTISGFIAEEAPKKPEENTPKVPVPEVKPEVQPEVKPEVKPEVPTAGSDSKIQKGAGTKKSTANTQTPKRETPAERKARLAAESAKGAE